MYISERGILTGYEFEYFYMNNILEEFYILSSRFVDLKNTELLL